MLAAGALTAASCTDFSDYNETPAPSTPAASQTLWQNISQNSQLTNFAALLKRAGFDSYLSEARAYTVWAPLDGQFDPSAYSSMSDSLLLAQFVKNHIAEFNYLATGNMDPETQKPVHMLNGKSYDFVGSEGNYSFDNVRVSTANQASSNGILHFIDGAAKFYPNLYEYLAEKDNQIDSVAKYIKRYEKTELNLEESEKGPMVNGMQTYVDSVMITSNSLLGRNGINASLDNEDSTYTFVMPTNSAYEKTLAKVKECYKFIPTTVMQDIETLTKPYGKNAAGDRDRNKVQKKTSTINAVYMQDSLARRAIIQNLVFSNNDAYNKFIGQRDPVTEGPEGTRLDTLRTTTNIRTVPRTLLSNPDEVLNKYMVGEPIEMSNGYGRLVDSLAILPWETYCPEVVVSPMRNMVKQFTAKTTPVNVQWPELAQELLGPGYEDFRYELIEPSGKNTPDFFIALPNVQSTTYNFYCVVLPAAVGVDQRPLPTPMNFDLSYCDAKGALANYHFSAKYLASGESKDQNPGTLDLNNTAFMNDPEKLDTMYLGQFTFPVNYRGLGDDYYPSLYISSPVNAFLAAQTDIYQREFRIFAIILRPVEKDEYEANNK